MFSKIKYCPAEEVILVDAEGRFDLERSISALRKLVSHPDYEKAYEILFDLRNINCAFSIAHIYQLVQLMALPDSLLPTRRKIAVTFPEDKNFDHAEFLENCAVNRGMKVMAFQDIREAEKWLKADL
jgi:hypothetical protein